MKEYYGSEGTRKDKANPFLSIINTTPVNISSKCGIFCTFYDDDVTYVIQEGYDDQILSHETFLRWFSCTATNIPSINNSLTKYSFYWMYKTHKDLLE